MSGEALLILAALALNIGLGLIAFGIGYRVGFKNGVQSGNQAERGFYARKNSQRDSYYGH